jgi:hypothetical protein
MSPKVIQVQPQDNHQLRLQFDNGETRLFDVTPYLHRGIFVELQSIEYFQQVKPFFGGVQWPNEQDFSPDTLYLTSSALGLSASVRSKTNSFEHSFIQEMLQDPPTVTDSWKMTRDEMHDR